MTGRSTHDPRLSALEAGMLYLVAEDQPLLVGSLLLFDGPSPDHTQVRAALAALLLSAPQLRHRLRRARHDLRRPVWVADESFTLDRHLHHEHVDDLDVLGLRALVPALMARPLTVAHPPWEVWHLDGLADGGWALVVRAHHSLVDGVSGTDLVLSMLDREPAERPAPRQPEPEPRSRDLLHRARIGASAVVHPDLPPCVLSGPLGAGRSWGWVTRELSEFEGACAARGCTLNELLLAALAGAYRSYLLEGGADPDLLGIRAIIPVSQRGTDTRVGTLASAMFVELPISAPTAEARVAAVQAGSADQRSRKVAAGTEALLELADHAPTALLAPAARAYARRGQRRVNLAVTNVRGPREPSTLLGRPLRELVPFVPLALSVRTTVGLVSQGGRVTVGVTGDSDALPDFDVLLGAVATALDELLGLQ